MPPTLGDRLAHILDAIERIERLMAGTTRQSFERDVLHRMATERLLEIISEASRRIPDETKKAQPDINWRGMADLGNRLRHAYHAIDVDVLWNIASRDLPPLKSFVQTLIRSESQE
jgi:uncharacterized protein with HEPN domain